MPAEFELPGSPESGAEAGKFSIEANARVEAQLNTPADINSAHQYFSPQGDAGLPQLNLGSTEASAASAAAQSTGPGSETVVSHLTQAIGHETAALSSGLTPGAESAALSGAPSVHSGVIAPGAESALSIAPGAESALTMAPTGAEAALAALNEPISPLIQLIMKMPGFTGIMNSVFEFFGALFGGNLLEAFNPMLWFNQLAGAVSAIEHLPISISLIPANAPIFQFLGPGMGNMFHPNIANQIAGGTGLEHAVNAGDLNVSAPVDAQNVIFEKTGNYTITEHPRDSLFSKWENPDTLAVNPDTPVYKPTMGGFYNPSLQGSPAAAPQAPTSHVQASASTAPTHTSNSHHSSHGSSHASRFAARSKEVAFDHKRVAHTDSSSATTSDASAQQSMDGGNGSYTVQRGDNLWDIARRQLGDGSRWSEIYKLNADTLGNNPDLIFSGTELKMPSAGGDIASAAGEAGKYTVQPGDNLWNIAKQHAGGGENWGDVYRMNEGVIGSNPDLIHPGQQLDLPGSEQQIAAVSDSVPQAATDPNAIQAAQQSAAQAVMPNSAGSPPVSAPSNFSNSVNTEVQATPVDQTSASVTPSGEMFQAPDGALFIRKPSN